jgi:CDP-diacylglycerol--glycerol-3-phosphate 3-phosphatidyltransferase
LISATFLAQGRFLLGSILFGAFSLLDLLDGTMARMLGTSGPWGAFLDSTLDRISDSAVIIALIYFYLHANVVNAELAVVAGIISLLMSLLTSYARAKAESLDAKCTVGIAERAERNFIIWVALLISGLATDVTPYALALLAVLSSITVVQRIIFVRKQLVYRV